MQTTLVNLRDRLSDLSKRNRSLRLLRLYDKWNFDLAQLDKLKDVKRATTEQLCKKLISVSGSIFLVESNSDNESAAKASHRLASLFRNLNAIEEETGTYSLFVGYPFLKGTLIDGTYIQAPVFLFPVRLERITAKTLGWSLSINSKEEVIPNRTLLLAFQKYNQMKIDEEIYEEARAIPKEGFESWVSDLLNRYGVKCHPLSKEVLPLTQYSQKEIPSMRPGLLAIVSHMILGHFPQGNTALIRDYDELMQLLTDEDEFGLVSDLLLEGDDISSEGTWDGIEPIELDEIPEKEVVPVSLLDASQEEVIHAIDKTDGLVVHGPPGTGKSQVIVNLISKAVSKDQKVLVVCQKRAALDVVYQRLQEARLSEQVALVHDAAKDRKDLYKKIDHCLEDDYFNQVQLNLMELNRLSNEIESKTQYLNRIANALWKQQPCGLSAYKLYADSKRLTTDEVLLDLGDLPGKFDHPGLEKLLPVLNRLGNYFGKYGHENYSWVERKSFAKMDNTSLYRLKQLLGQACALSEDSNRLKSSDHVEKFDPGSCWDMEHVLSKGIRTIEGYNNQKFLSNISLWFWVKFTGKPVVERLAGHESVRGFKSDRWKSIEKAIVQIYQYGTTTRNLDGTVADFSSFLTDIALGKLKSAVRSGDISPTAFHSLLDDLERDFEELVEMDILIDQLDENGARLLSILLRDLPVVPDPELGSLWKQVILKSFYTSWIDMTEKECPELRNISTGKYEEMLEEYKTQLNKKKTLVPHFLRAKLVNRILRFRSEKPRLFRELKHQVGKSRMVWPIRRLMNTFWQEGLLEVVPVWLVSPETVSTVFPLVSGLFDIVIFDEASQCPVENGIPAFFRAQKVIVAGDEKQLPPNDLFRVSLDSEEDEEYSAGVDDSRSLLNLCKRSYPTKLLSWHYRSKHEELINFSNHAFYGGRVQIAPNVKPYAVPPAIEWVEVCGVWDNQCNEAEAQEVCYVLKKLFLEYPAQTVGVITFNQKQQQRILDLLERAVEEDLEFSGLYNAVMTRPIDERLFVKNIENVQGDERDIIVFSVAYGRNTQGKVVANFGTLGHQGGENRLNVAITRAKEKIIVLCSVKPEEFPVGDTKNPGPKLFKQYLRYAHAVAQGDHVTVTQVLKEINPSLRVDNAEDKLHFDSIFEEQVYNLLVQRGYQVKTQVGCSGYRIDLGVVDPNDPSSFVIGVECDGAMYHIARSARERDIYRQRFLESKGWKIVRIWSRNWWQNPEREIDRVIRESFLRSE